jgi:DNA-directed RNA polymerase specialized sigma24 family protein
MSDDDEEVIQTVLLKLLELQRTGGAAHARSEGRYVRAMARNATWDLLRSRRRTSFVADVVDQPCDERVTDLLEEATLSVLQSYIAGLPSDLAAVFAARFVRGLSQACVCRELAISRQHLRTLEQRLKRGAARLLAARDSPQEAAPTKRQRSRKRTNQNGHPRRL